MSKFEEAKQAKLARIRPLLAREPAQETPLHFDFLTAEVRAQFGIVDTTAVSQHGYDPYAVNLMNRHASGLVLDCGAGKRPDYLENVVNFEIVPYDSTDVVGVGEDLPFRDASFEGVLCLNVLEHVKNPFRVAREIARVLKPGGELYCVVPFLQPVHAFPHHYYNMTSQGLCNLFDGELHITDTLMLASGLPIWTLSAILQIWASGLTGETRERFLNMRVVELMQAPIPQLKNDYVTGLSREKNFELACTTAILAVKPPISA